MTAEDQTERISLGPTDLQVSPMGVGAWAWGDRYFWGYGSSYTEDDVRGAFLASLEAGINVFDTAEVYGFGQSERLLGGFVKDSDHQAVVATKFMPLPWRLRRKNLADALRGSLQRLGSESVDLYQIHWPSPPVSVENWMGALADAVDAGLVRAVGVSNYNVDQLRRAHGALAKRGVPLASNQVHYSLLERGPERTGLLKACRELNVTLIAYSPLAQGLLTGKYSAAEPPSGLLRGRRAKSRLAKMDPLLSHLRELGNEHGKTPAQVAVNWVIRKGALPIPGAKNAQQAKDNAGALGWHLSSDEVGSLDEASDQL